MNQSSKKKLIIALISIFVLILAVLFIVYAFYYSIEINSSGELKKQGEDISDIGQMKTDCISLGCSEESKSIYVGSKNSDKYYECSCRYAKTIKPENIVCFASDAEALADERAKAGC